MAKRKTAKEHVIQTITDEVEFHESELDVLKKWPKTIHLKYVEELIKFQREYIKKLNN